MITTTPYKKKKSKIPKETQRKNEVGPFKTTKRIISILKKQEIDLDPDTINKLNETIKYANHTKEALGLFTLGFGLLFTILYAAQTWGAWANGGTLLLNYVKYNEIVWELPLFTIIAIFTLISYIFLLIKYIRRYYFDK